MHFMFHFPSQRITTLDLQLSSGVLKSAGRELPFAGELLLQDLFQQSHTSQQVWLEYKLGMKWSQRL